MENIYLQRRKAFFKIKVKRSILKEIKFRPSTDVGDYNIKLKDKKLYS